MTHAKFRPGVFRKLLLRLMKAAVRRRFPDVPQITSEQLAEWLTDPNRTAPALLDVRSAEEFEVSHLPGAVRVDPDTAMGDLEKRFQREQSMVLYCAGGYRSSTLANRMRQGGFEQVLNLDGAIFQWATEKRPLQRPDGSSTTKVHPVDWFSSKFLPKEVRSGKGKLKGES